MKSIFAILGLSLFLVPIKAEAFKSACGLFQVVKGDVQYLEKKTTKKLKKAKKFKRICSGGTVVTGANGRAKIKMPTNKKDFLHISPNSKVVIADLKKGSGEEKRVLIDVIYGKLRANLKKDSFDNTKKNQFRVKTKSAVAGVRGTQFLTAQPRGPAPSEIITFKGQVEVGQPTGNGFNFKNPVMVGAGQKTSIAPNQAPKAPITVPAGEMQQLEKETMADPGPQQGTANNDQPAGDKKDDGKKADADKREPAGDDGAAKDDGAKKDDAGNKDSQAGKDNKRGPQAGKDNKRGPQAGRGNNNGRGPRAGRGNGPRGPRGPAPGGAGPDDSADGGVAAGEPNEPASPTEQKGPAPGGAPIAGEPSEPAPAPGPVAREPVSPQPGFQEPVSRDPAAIPMEPAPMPVGDIQPDAGFDPCASGMCDVKDPCELNPTACSDIAVQDPCAINPISCAGNIVPDIGDIPDCEFCNETIENGTTNLVIDIVFQ